jgi:hypothetical protein
VEQVGGLAAGLALALYALALFLAPVEGALRADPRPAVLHLIYGASCGWCWAAVPLLVLAGAALASGRNRTAVLLAVVATAAGLPAHLDAARNTALGGGYFAWQAAVLVVGIAGAIKWAVLGTSDPGGSAVARAPGGPGPRGQWLRGSGRS